MTIKDRFTPQLEGQDMLGGKGKWVARMLFQGEIAPTKACAHMILEPGTYAGYHQHHTQDSILYILSGTAEHYQDGERCILESGDAVLVKSGHPHAAKNIGDTELEVLEFLADPIGENPSGSSVTCLPLPDVLADWV